LYSKLSKSLLLLGSCGTEETITLPFASPSETIQSVDCGRAHVVVCSGDGHVYTTGHNVFGQCGYYSGAEVSVVDCIKQSSFLRIDGLEEKAVQVACGFDHSLILTEKGTVYSCGWSADGQTGLESNRNVSTPQQVYGHLDSRQIKQIATSTDCSLAVATGGTVYGWGNSEYQQLAIDTTETQVTVPTVIPSDLFDGEVVSVASGGSFSLFLTLAGKVYSVGYGAGLGLGKNIVATSVPKVISFSTSDDDEVIQIYASVDYAAAVTGNGNLFVWGHNRHNQFGPQFKQFSDLWKPTHVTLPFRIDSVHLGVDCMAVTRKDFN
jgi:alpha-tubulin suppressor-like RCC1 family protein